MADKKLPSKKSARRPQPVRFSTWASTSTPELEDEYMDLSISLRFTIERQRR